MNSNKLALPFRFLERFPKFCLFITFGLLIGLWITTGVLYAVRYDIAPFVMDFLPIQVPESTWYQRASAILSWHTHNTGDYMNHYKSLGSVDRGLINTFKIDLFYKVNGNILTEENLKRMKNIEDEITNVKGYDNFFRQPYSLLRFFYTNVTNEKTTKFLDFLMKHQDGKELVTHALPTSFKIKPKLCFSYSNLLRSSLVPKFSKDRPNLLAVMVKILDPILKKHWKMAKESGEYEFAYHNSQMYYNDLAAQAKHDTVYTVGSFLFILIVLLFHTRSIALTAAAIFGILSSILGGNLIYRVILNQRYLGVFHCITLFVVLGIGVDDVFVLFDVWRDSFDCTKSQPLSHGHRMAAVFREAMLPMFITSLTTALAFFVNVACEVPIVSTFGLFTGLVVTVNYLMVITFLPCVLINQQLFYEWLDRSKFGFTCIPVWITPKDEPCGDGESRRWIVRFFVNFFFRIIRVKFVAAGSLILSLLISGLFLWRATKLAPAKSFTDLFARGTNYFQANKFDAEFKKTTLLTLDIIWGLRMRNRSMCHKHDFKCRGEMQYDNQLDLNLWDAQRALLNFTRRLKSDSALANRLRIKRESGKNLVDCFLLDMQNDMLYQRNKNKSGCIDGGPLDLTLPIGQKKVERLMSCHPDLYGSKTFRQSLNLNQWYDRFFETALNYWLQNAIPGYNVPVSSQANSYTHKDVTVMPLPQLHRSMYKFERNYGGRLQIISVHVTLNLTSTSDNFFTGVRIRDNWERFIEESNAQFPLGLRGAFQCMSHTFPKTPISAWEWYDIQEKLWYNAQTGILLGLFAVALPILLLSTKSLVLTFIGILCLCCVTVTVVAMTELAGWSLGITESINFAMVTGLSVDHIVHFIEAYSRSEARTREEKSREMLMRMGGAVTSGMLSTIGSSSFLFGGSVIFFIQFGAFMATTIGSAFCFSLFLLTPFLILCGPTQPSIFHLLVNKGRRMTKMLTHFKPDTHEVI